MEKSQHAEKKRDQIELREDIEKKRYQVKLNGCNEKKSTVHKKVDQVKKEIRQN